MRLDPLGLRLIHVPSEVTEPAMVFYGDSRMSQWPQPPWLAEPVVNLDIAGQMTRQILDRFDTHLAPLHRRPFWSDRVDSAIREVNQTIKSFESDGVIVLDTAAVLTDGSGKLVPAYSRDFLHLSPEGYAQLNNALHDFLDREF